jgi:hypothetical protein
MATLKEYEARIKAIIPYQWFNLFIGVRPYQIKLDGELTTKECTELGAVLSEMESDSEIK